MCDRCRCICEVTSSNSQQKQQNPVSENSAEALFFCSKAISLHERMGGGIPTDMSLPTSESDMTVQSSLNGGHSDGDEMTEVMGKRIFDIMNSRRNKIYKEVMDDYVAKSMLETHEALKDAKTKILSYKPGSLIQEVGGFHVSDYEIPTTMILLVIGLKNSGKSSLINRILRVLEGDMFFKDRAQVSFAVDNQAGEGTCFLQEYMIRGGSASFSLYDTRGLSEKPSEDIKLLKKWMTEGVQHGRVVVRDSDSVSAKSTMNAKARHSLPCCSQKRKVNFVIFVVDAVSVLKSMSGLNGTQYTSLLAEYFKCPYLSFKDDKPVLVITHTDELTCEESVSVRIHLGNLLGISPTRQIFDAADSSRPMYEFSIMDMLHYCLEHADRNLPCMRRPPVMHVSRNLTFKSSAALMNFDIFSTAARLLLLILVYILIDAAIKIHSARRQSSEVHIDWKSIRHMWMG